MTCSFLDHSTKSNENFEKASIEVPSRANCSSFDVPRVKIGAFLLHSKAFLEEKNSKISAFFLALRIQSNPQPSSDSKSSEIFARIRSDVFSVSRGISPTNRKIIISIKPARIPQRLPMIILLDNYGGPAARSNPTRNYSGHCFSHRHTDRRNNYYIMSCERDEHTAARSYHDGTAVVSADNGHSKELVRPMEPFRANIDIALKTSAVVSGNIFRIKSRPERCTNRCNLLQPDLLVLSYTFVLEIFEIPYSWYTRV